MQWDWSASARRDRKLAGSARAGSWARGRARRAQRAYLRRTWRRLALFLIVWFVVIIAVAVVTANDVLKGVVIGAGLVAAPFMVWMLVVQVTGTGPTMMGDVAEQWTAQELRPLTHQGWRLVNHFALARDDMDHLLIGPGGAIVFETKWRSEDWLSRDGLERQRRAAGQAEANAHRLALWTPFKARSLTARPVVVLWGGDVAKLAEQHPSEPCAEIEGVVVVAGPSLRAWLAGALQPARSEAPSDELWTTILTQVVDRDAHDHESDPLPMSAADLALRGSVTLFAAAFSLLILIELLQRTQSWWTFIAAALFLGVGAWGARGRRTAWIGWGVASGAVLFVLASAILLLVAALA